MQAARSGTSRLKDFLPYNHFIDLDVVRPLKLAAMKMNEQQRQRGETLLAVDDVALAITFADDDRAKKIVAILLDFGSVMFRSVSIKESRPEVVEKFAHLLVLPFVFALIVINRILGSVQELADGLGFALDFFHRLSCRAVRSLRTDGSGLRHGRRATPTAARAVGLVHLSDQAGFHQGAWRREDDGVLGFVIPKLLKTDWLGALYCHGVIVARSWVL